MNLTLADLHLVDLREADLTGAILLGADFTGANLARTDLSGADLREADLRKINLSDAILNGSVLRGASLAEANLVSASLAEADLSKTILNRANLVWANLSGSILCDANLRDADMSCASLYGTDLSGADLHGANFSRVRLSRAVFAKNDLGVIRGLDSVRHAGPSSISTDLIFRSAGKIPEVFLRGCGVPESLIEYLPSLVGAMQPIQFYSCFISHSSQDHDFAQRLYERMQSHRLRVWFAPEDLKAGQKLHEQIDQAIRRYDKLVLVLSEASINSEWVKTEIRKARKAEIRDNRRKLFPIRLIDFEALAGWECYDSTTGSDLAEEVRQYFIPDFTGWKDHDTFERAFAKLLDALKAVDAPPIPRAPEPSKVTSSRATIIESKRRRLQILEEQQARKGHDTEPHIVMEIEDLRTELEGMGKG